MTATVAGIHLGPDTHANRPAAGTPPVGSLYSCSTHSLVYRTDGSTWSTWATLGSTAVTDATITTTDVTTNNVSTSKHGWAPKADGNAAHYLDGTGAYSTPAGSGGTVFDGKPFIWTPPGSANAKDDEFADGSSQSGPINGLDAKWSKHNLGTSGWLIFDDAQAPSCLLLDIPTGQAPTRRSTRPSRLATSG
jgi:hypothetical protein